LPRDQQVASKRPPSPLGFGLAAARFLPLGDGDDCEATVYTWPRAAWARPLSGPPSFRHAAAEPILSTVPPKALPGFHVPMMALRGGADAARSVSALKCLHQLALLGCPYWPAGKGQDSGGEGRSHSEACSDDWAPGWSRQNDGSSQCAGDVMGWVISRLNVGSLRHRKSPLMA
jgi:hypothetical protein